MGACMRGLGLIPDVILVSSSRRTQETMEALGSWDERPNIETLPGLYMASEAQIRETLRELPETVRSVLVIGHNPGMHEVARALAGRMAGKPELERLADSFPTASLAEFLVATPWHRLGHAGTSLKRFIRPADLPAAAG